MRRGKIYLYLIVNVIYFSLQTPKNISMPYKGFNYLISCQIKVGSLEKIAYYPINNKLNFTWIGQRDYKSLDSPTAKTNGINIIDIGTEKYNALDIIDNISLSDSIPPIPYRFYQTSVQSYIVKDSGFAFAYKFDNEDFSIVHQLKKNNITDYLSYTVSPFEKDENYHGLIYFGKFPRKIIQGKHVGKCKVNDKYSSWYCTLKSVSIGNKQFYNKDDMAISTINGDITIPKAFFNFLELEVFDIKNNKCKVVTESKKNSSFFMCIRAYVEEFKGTVDFIIGDYKLSLPLHKFFDCNSLQLCQSSFVYRTTIEDNLWIIGYSFYINYITTFDSEKGEILFYSNERIKKVYDNEHLEIVGIYTECNYFSIIISLYIILISGCCIIIIDKIKRDIYNTKINRFF